MHKPKEIIPLNNRFFITLSSFIIMFIFTFFFFGYNLFIYFSQEEKYENLFLNHLKVTIENQMLISDLNTLQEKNQMLHVHQENLEEKNTHLENNIEELKINLEEILLENASLKEDNIALRKKLQ